MSFYTCFDWFKKLRIHVFITGNTLGCLFYFCHIILQNDSSMDENGIAAAILQLATSFCRGLIFLPTKLCTFEGLLHTRTYTCVVLLYFILG
jgi:hypothetical protein